MNLPFQRKRVVMSGVAALTLAVTALAAPPVQADAVSDFYKGRDVTFLVGYPPGGSYAAYARLSAPHMSKYIPGNPTIVVKNMAGGGSLRATNFLYNAAPKDGTVLGFVADTIAVSQLLFPKKAKYDASKMSYIGSFTPINPVVMIRSDHAVKTMEDAMKTEVIVGCTGAGSQSYIMPRALKEILGAKFKLVCGYRGSAAMTLALIRGDLNAQSSAWASWRIRYYDDIKAGKLIPLVQIGLKREKELPNVRLMQELTDDPETKQILEFLSVGGAVGRTIIAPPGVPEARIAALRAAFDKTV
ncbi:MAG TPA: tripartite tricarboxylate transporter substrate-binding protein, partial [Alphaproteobacteria bacterium]|nr:tripartite tricarboxylate transporter substrate-binding protein [Alphaproteobacteria bacterium]